MKTRGVFPLCPAQNPAAQGGVAAADGWAYLVGKMQITKEGKTAPMVLPSFAVNR